MIDTILISTVILFFLVVILSRPINNLIRCFKNWIKLIKFIKKARERYITEFQILTTSDKIIVLTKERDKTKPKRIALNY
jgi:hypothetical protein